MVVGDMSHKDAHLRTEVKRLKGDLASLGATRTPDGGLKIDMKKYHAAHRCDEHRKEPWGSQDLDKCMLCLEHERDEALAQVAVSLKFLQKVADDKSSMGWWVEADRTLINLPIEARALLDRLKKLEKTDLEWLALYHKTKDQLERAETVVEAAQDNVKSKSHQHINVRYCLLCKALAAWEEGKTR